MRLHIKFFFPSLFLFIDGQWSLCLAVTTHHVLLEPQRVHTQQNHNCEHCGTLNSKISEIAPKKKTPKNHTNHFPHYSFSSLQTAALKWLWSIWEFMGVNKNYFEIRGLSVWPCNSMEKEPFSPSSSRFPAVLRALLFKFSQKPETHPSAGNVQETFQGWLRENFPLHAGKISFWGSTALPDFIAFPKHLFVASPYSYMKITSQLLSCVQSIAVIWANQSSP